VDEKTDPKQKPDSSEEEKSTRYVSLVPFSRVIIFIVLVLLVFGCIFVVPGILDSYGIVKVTTGGVDIFVVLMLGVLVGFIELISRYKDAPFRTATTYPGLFYMLINGLVAIGALMMVQLFGWSFIPGNATVSPEVERWTQVLVAGLGAMSIFRSSIMVIGKGDQEVSVGPSAVLEILLDAIDKEVDRFRGQSRAKLVKILMQDITYEDALKDLPTLCAALMQNLQTKEGEKIKELPGKVTALQSTTKVKKFQLGLKLMEIVGEEVLRQAIIIMKKDENEVDEPESSEVSQEKSQENLQEALDYLDSKK